MPVGGQSKTFPVNLQKSFSPKIILLFTIRMRNRVNSAIHNWKLREWFYFIFSSPSILIGWCARFPYLGTRIRSLVELDLSNNVELSDLTFTEFFVVFNLIRHLNISKYLELIDWFFLNERAIDWFNLVIFKSNLLLAKVVYVI